MTVLEFYKSRLKKNGFTQTQIKALTKYRNLELLEFAEEYHTEQLRLLSVVKSVKENTKPDLIDWIRDNKYKITISKIEKNDVEQDLVDVISKYEKEIALQL